MDNESDEILKTDSLGRVRTSRERQEAILNDFERSGVSGRAYARGHGIKYQTFANWIQKRRRSRGEYDKGRSESASSVEEPAEGGMGLTLAEVRIEEPRQRESAGGLQVELPGGARLMIDNTKHAELAAALIGRLTSK